MAMTASEGDAVLLRSTTQGRTFFSIPTPFFTGAPVPRKLGPPFMKRRSINEPYVNETSIPPPPHIRGPQSKGPRGPSAPEGLFQFFLPEGAPWARRRQPYRICGICGMGGTPLALRMLHVVTGYSNNTLSCSELIGEHAGEDFISIRHILTQL